MCSTLGPNSFSTSTVNCFTSPGIRTSKRPSGDANGAHFCLSAPTLQVTSSARTAIRDDRFIVESLVARRGAQDRLAQRVEQLGVSGLILGMQLERARLVHHVQERLL